MPPNQFHIALQHGILGGILPARPSAHYTLTGHGKNVHVQSAVRSADTPDLKEQNPKSLSLSDTEHDKLVNELHGILKSIPTEDPPGCEDIYGMNTSIAWGSEDLQWRNKAPGGCIHGVSLIQPTDEEKAKFKRAVEIVKLLVDKAN